MTKQFKGIRTKNILKNPCRDSCCLKKGCKNQCGLKYNFFNRFSNFALFKEGAKN